MGAGVGALQPQPASGLHHKVGPEPANGEDGGSGGSSQQPWGGIAWLLSAIDREKAEKEWLANKYEWLATRFDEKCVEVRKLQEELAVARNDLRLAKTVLEKKAPKHGEAVAKAQTAPDGRARPCSPLPSKKESFPRHEPFLRARKAPLAQPQTRAEQIQSLVSQLVVTSRGCPPSAQLVSFDGLPPPKSMSLDADIARLDSEKAARGPSTVKIFADQFAAALSPKDVCSAVPALGVSQAAAASPAASSFVPAPAPTVSSAASSFVEAAGPATSAPASSFVPAPAPAASVAASSFVTAPAPAAAAAASSFVTAPAPAAAAAASSFVTAPAPTAAAAASSFVIVPAPTAAAAASSFVTAPAPAAVAAASSFVTAPAPAAAAAASSFVTAPAPAAVAAASSFVTAPAPAAAAAASFFVAAPAPTVSAPPQKLFGFEDRRASQQANPQGRGDPQEEPQKSMFGGKKSMKRCGREGCQYARTWHESHCCKKCLQTSGEEHGLRCEKKVWEDTRGESATDPDPWQQSADPWVAGAGGSADAWPKPAGKHYWETQKYNIEWGILSHKDAWTLQKDDELFRDRLGDSVGPGFTRYDSFPVEVSGEGSQLIPACVSFDDMFQKFGGYVVTELVQNIQRCKDSVPTPVQKYATPVGDGGGGSWGGGHGDAAASSNDAWNTDADNGSCEGGWGGQNGGWGGCKKWYGSGEGGWGGQNGGWGGGKKR